MKQWCAKKLQKKAKLEFVAKLANCTSILGKRLGQSLFGVNTQLGFFFLLGEIDTALCLTTHFQSSDHVLVLPSYFMGKTAQWAVLASVVQLKNTQSRWHHHALLLVIRRWNTFGDTQTAQSFFTSLCLVGDHSTNGTPENLRWSAEVEWSTLGVYITPLAQKSQVLHYLLILKRWSKLVKYVEKYFIYNKCTKWFRSVILLR